MDSLRFTFARFYLAMLLRNGAFWLPTLYLYILSLGLSYRELMILLAVQSVSQVIFELPSGVSGDLLGRKWTLVMAGVIHASGVLCLGVAHSFWPLVAAFALLGAGYAFHSGTDSAYIYDTLKEFGKESEYKRYEGYSLSAGWLGLGLGSFFGGFLAVVDPSYPTWATFISVALGTAVALTFREPRINFELPEHRYFSHLLDAAKFMATHPRVRWLMLLSALIISLSILSFRFLQPLLEGVGVPLPYFGTIYLIWLLFSIYAAQKAFDWERRFGERAVLTALPVALGAGFLLCASSVQWVVLAGTIPLQVAFGFTMPVIGDYVNRHVDSSHRATVLSFRGFAQSILSAVMAPLFGWYADLHGLPNSIAAMGVLCLAGGLFVAWRIRCNPAHVE